MLHIYIHTHIHTYIHTYIRTYIQVHTIIIHTYIDIQGHDNMRMQLTDVYNEHNNVSMDIWNACISRIRPN